MATCKECLHYDACGGYLPSDLDADVFDYCKNGIADEIPDIDERCSSFKDKSSVLEPPVKVGDKIFQTDGIRIYESTIHEITYTSNKVIYVTENIVFDETAIGTSIFLTREDSEQALKERTNNEPRRD